ncbi:MAG TPA: polysaccharide biosynthesis tyrosine autokinase [Burkholderiaceae bacterium]|nr:polysaccharide biosynthesis tyrosine autokinase [Burkholderiaceae bacterium]
MSNISAIQHNSLPERTDVRPEPASLRIGEILVRDGRLTREQVERVLHVQQETGGRFGEIAIRMKFVQPSHVDDALAEQFGNPTRTELIRAKVPAKIAAAFSPASPFVESVRGLRSQLILRWFDGTPGQTALAVTSVDRGDGKSFITAALGVAFSQLGEHTLVIDADLRHPTQHDIFGVPNRLGLSGILSGRADYSEIAPLAGLANLSILASGALPPNPQELLGRPAFGMLLNELSTRYDVILVDTPSAQEASDAHVVAQRARAVLMVGRKDKTRSQEIAQLAAVFANSGVAILGATLNEY